MRVVGITLLILVIFVVGTFMLDQYINHSCDELLEDISLLNESIKDNDWPKAKEELIDLKEQWEYTKKRWQLFLEHYEMDAIDIAIARLDEYVEIEDQSLSLGEMAEFRLLIGHIKEKEGLSLQNIF